MTQCLWICIFVYVYTGSPHPGLLLQGHDSVAHQEISYAPTTLDGNRNVLRIAREPLPRDQAYDGIRNPYVLVINNVNFYGDPRPRNGASHDLMNVERFVKEAGFKSFNHFDLSKHGMLDILEQTRQNGKLGKWQCRDLHFTISQWPYVFSCFCNILLLWPEVNN